MLVLKLARMVRAWFDPDPDPCKGQHYWRPALLNGFTARHCPDCELTQTITLPEFYAQFGETGLALLRRR